MAADLATTPLLATRVLPRGGGLAPALLTRAPALVLDWAQRQRSRFEATDTLGRRVGVVLPRGTVLRGSDALVLTNGDLLRVEAAPEPLLRVTPCPQHGTPGDLLRAAYHLGNRHVALQIAADHLQLERDHVLADMLRGLHLDVTEVEAPFEPETGAYGHHGSTHRHGHGHDHEHDPIASVDNGHRHAP
ncbi:Urease accessory protein UreE 1 [Tepidimonas thermarum]|uniref:Urease accessory protein UreE n=1 Tax=Tepidimonas thermarum TaxID=335431 RepID=A0A554X307_9BURK|nr:Urease accessory protein UreE 1 [Tepidimonas thermarum]